MRLSRRGRCREYNAIVIRLGISTVLELEMMVSVWRRVGCLVWDSALSVKLEGVEMRGKGMAPAPASKLTISSRPVMVPGSFLVSSLRHLLVLPCPSQPTSRDYGSSTWIDSLGVLTSKEL